jgi:uncharacterized protein
MRIPILVAAILLAVCPAVCFARSVEWQSWSATPFIEAARQHKFVILEIESAGSHWCHVMDQETFAGSAVKELIAQNYIAVRVDANARPDVANRYRDYELPATIIFNSDGSEIVRKQRFLSGRQMVSLLKAVVADPTPVDSIRPEPSISYSTSPALAKDLSETLSGKFNSQYSQPDQNWSFGTDYIDTDSVEYASLLARSGDKSRERWVVDRMAKLRMLIDPVWGGVFQSLVVPVTADEDQRAARFVKIQLDGVLDTEGDSWNDPHFEKPLLVEAAAMRMFAMAYGQWHNPDDLSAARSVQRYIRAFLTSPDGAFYAGQDGDIAGVSDSSSYFQEDDPTRRSHGLPQVDTKIYTNQNGRMIEALCQLFAVTGDRADLQDAERCANWIVSQRSIIGGGFAHAGDGPQEPYLCDSVAAGQAFLALYEVSKDQRWLEQAAAADHFIDATFRGESDAGFVSVQSASAPGYKPHRDRQENSQVARLAHQLAFYTGDKAHDLIATRSMRYLVTPEIATVGFPAAVLLANSEFTDPGPTSISGSNGTTREDSR